MRRWCQWPSLPRPADAASPRNSTTNSPLTAHPSGRWCKKHRGQQYYFGRIDDWQSALERYQQEWPYIIDGRTPPPDDVGDGCTIRELCNSFLTGKRSKLDSGELTAGRFSGYFSTCQHIVDHFGRDRHVDDLRPDDFQRFRSALAKKWGLPVSKTRSTAFALRSSMRSIPG
jgi:hypothetical protein